MTSGCWFCGGDEPFEKCPNHLGEEIKEWEPPLLDLDRLLGR